ncbi:MAG: hypothetical protein ACF8Q5_03650 [Phycisphaerales bacterium JB040]
MPQAPDRAPHHLIDAVYRYAIPLLALLAAGPLCYRFTHALISASGTHDKSLFLAASKPSALIALLVCLALATLVATGATRLIGLKSGLISAGYVLGWAAWGLGDLNRTLRDLESASAGTFILLAIEAAALVTACLGVLWLAARADPHPPHKDLFRPGLSPKRLISIGAATLAALAACWIVVHTGTKGQTLFGALVAGLLAGVAAHMAGDEEHPDPLAPFLGVALAALLSPLITIAFPGLGAVEKAVVADALPGFARLQPLDWSVALLIGVPIGLSWMGIALGRDHASGAAATAKA